MRHSLLFLLSASALSVAGLPKVWGQTLYVGDEQVITVLPNTRVVIEGNLLIRGTLTNQGTLQINGDWRNEAMYADGAGSEVVLAGADQIIDHRGQAIHHLSVRGSGTKELRSAIRVVDTLTLKRGMLQSSAATPIELAATATVAGGSSESFVESTMVYRGTGRRRFPLGLAGAYLPLTLTSVEGEAPTLRVSVVAPNPAASPDESLARVSSARYWRIETVGGTFTGSPVELAVNRGDGLDDLIGAVVAQSAEPGGQFVSVGQSDQSGDAVQGTITSADPVNRSIVAVGVTSLFSVENQVLVPSAFAPDAPNPTNRSVKIYASTLRADSFLFRIFDRWGNLVYQTASLSEAREQGWEGRRRSDRSAVPAGVYQYHLRGFFENGAPVDQSGTITLFR